MDFAVLYDGRRSYCGWGKWKATSLPNVNSFWINNFDLDSGTPWVTFEHFAERDSVPAEFLAELPNARSWELLEREDFRALWQASRSDLESGAIKKIVLALSDRTRDFKQGVALKPEFFTRPGYFYAFTIGQESAWGLSPELLFSTEDQMRVQTMALAGTFAEGGTAGQELKPEHAYVVDFFREIAQRNDVELVATPKEELSQGNLRHLLTRIELRGTRPFPLEHWIRELHPTPSLGVYPRGMPQLEKLQTLREGLPPYYGAPFGLNASEVSLFIVMIRGHFCDGETLRRSLGVGVTAHSEYESEWKELQLKRASMELLWQA